MHELGVVFYIIRDVKQVAEANNVNKIKSVTVEIGEVSGVIPEMLDDCWKWAIKKEPVVDGAELKIETMQAITFCEDCEKEFPTVEHGKTCPHCGSGNTYLIRGRDCSIKEIAVLDE